MRTIEKKVLRPSLLIFLLPLIGILLFGSCQNPIIGFGSSIVSNNANSNNTSITEVDTISVNLSTILLDSFPTAASGSMLLGYMDNPNFGKINSKCFFQIGTPSGYSGLNNQSVFDSLILMMRINKSYYGDTTLNQRYYVSQLNEIIQFPNRTQTTYYNNSSFSYNPVPLGFTDVTILPTRGLTSLSVQTLDSVKIALPDTLGQHLFNMMLNNSDTINNINSFLSYFKGLVVYPDTRPGYSGTMYGFKDTVTMRLFYHQPGVYTEYKFIDFKYYNKSNQFNNITVDRSSTPLSGLAALQASRTNPLIPTEIPSSQTNHACYIQSATGILGKITFPSINSVLGLPGYLSILKAELIMRPINTTFSPLLNLPPQLILAQTTLNNQLGAPITYNGATETGSLYTDYSGFAFTQYSYDITNYISQISSIGGNVQYGLIISLPSPSNNTIFNGAVFGDVTNVKYNISLKLYYVSIPH